MKCRECVYWEQENETGVPFYRCTCDPSPRLDDETEAEDGCEYGKDWPTLDRTIGWLNQRLRGTLMPGTETMYRAAVKYLEKLEALDHGKAD